MFDILTEHTMMFTTKPGHRSGVRVLKVKVRVEVRAIFKKKKEKKLNNTLMLYDLGWINTCSP